MVQDRDFSAFSYKPVTLEKVLRRISIPRGQVTLLKALYEAEDKFAQRKELVERIRWGDSKSFTGVLAAFSGRINHTEGFEGEKPGYEAFIEVKEIDGEESFRLRPEARQAIERVENLVKTFDQPMEDLLEGIEVEPKGMPPGGSEFSVTYEPWLPDTPEDQLLVSYWENVGGAIIAEVPTGSGGPSNWPDAAKNRRIDGIRFKCKGRDEIYPPSAYTTEQIKKIVKGRHVEVIEAKQSLNRNVIG